MSTVRIGIDKTAYAAMILLLIFFILILYLKQSFIRNDVFPVLDSPKIVDRDLLLISNYQYLQDSDLGRGLTLLDYEEVNLADAVQRVQPQVVASGPRVQTAFYQTRNHRVREGESLWSISRNYDVSVAAIQSVNPNAHRNISPGQVLKIPNVDGILIAVARGQTLSSLAGKYELTVAKIMEFNQLSSASEIRAGQELFLPGAHLSASVTPTIQVRPNVTGTFAWPVPGYSRVGSPYGWRIHPISHRRRFHHGLDIPAPHGTRVVAWRAGRVQYAGWIRGYGRIIKILHDNNLVTYYAHLSSMGVQVGNYVEQGQTIGRVGVSGNVTGPHLHFEVRVNGESRNPTSYLGLGRRSPSRPTPSRPTPARSTPAPSAAPPAAPAPSAVSPPAAATSGSGAAEGIVTTE